MKLSIIIPTCDRPQFLNRAVTSALNNGGNDCEVIIVDDGLEKSAPSLTFDGDIKVITTPGRTGASAARNLGANHATGSHLLFLDDDIEPNRIYIVNATIARRHSTVDCINA